MKYAHHLIEQPAPNALNGPFDLLQDLSCRHREKMIKSLDLTKQVSRVSIHQEQFDKRAQAPESSAVRALAHPVLEKVVFFKEHSREQRLINQALKQRV
jgi:hypothetical protein